VSNDIEQIFFKDVRRTKVLSKEELAILIPLAQKGNKKALDKVVKSCIRFVAKVAKKYSGSRVPFTDLVAEGNIGLLIALEKFEPKMGNTFLSYAVWWIRQSIERHLETESTIRPPSNIHTLAIKVLREHGVTATIDEIQETLKCTKSVAVNVYSHIVQRTTADFDAPIKGDLEGTLTLAQLVGFVDEIEENVTKQEIVKLYDSSTHILNENEKLVLDRFYFYTGGTAPTLRDVSIDLGFSRERVRQIKMKALKKLRNKFSKKWSTDELSISSENSYRNRISGEV
jgi:RNA polymerase sigma factor (sigma-70 family)